MKQQKIRRTTRQPLALANEFSAPPIKPPRLAIAGLPKEPSLTEKFNRAAKQPQLGKSISPAILKKQIEALRQKMSRPQPTLELGMTGSVTKACNPHRDRLLFETMTALTEQLNQHKGLKNKFALAASKGEAKKAFNRSAKGFGI